MSINYGRAYRAFRKEQDKMDKQYRQFGMTEEQIEAMHEFDLISFRSDCVYAHHTQELMPQSSLSDDEGLNPYLEFFLDSFSMTDHSSDPFSWIDDIADERILKKLHRLSPDDILLITLYVYCELTQMQIAGILGISQYGVSKRLSALKKIF